MEESAIEPVRGNIVVVDDMRENLQLLIALLQDNGYTVRPALNGPRALESVRAELPDVILLDIMMPEMDGYEVCEALKADDRTRDIPVIFISGLDGTFDKLKAFSVGAVDYITKPFQAQEVLARVDTHLTLQRQKKALEAANKNLQEFASVVAHDLKAPLRRINQIAQFLAQDYAETLNVAGKDMLGLLHTQVHRMQALIEGVLRYSREGHIITQAERIDLNILVNEVIEALALPEHIRITVEHELPVMTADRIRLEQVFQNLLSNAITYMDKAEGKIIISCADEDDHWSFRISDNGPGIEQTEHEKIFQLFYTTATHNKESTGLGLALVKKIIESYNGKIWVESTVGEGSTFVFILPKHKVTI